MKVKEIIKQLSVFDQDDDLFITWFDKEWYDSYADTSYRGTASIPSWEDMCERLTNDDTCDETIVNSVMEAIHYFLSKENKCN